MVQRRNSLPLRPAKTISLRVTGKRYDNQPASWLLPAKNTPSQNSPRVPDARPADPYRNSHGKFSFLPTRYVAAPARPATWSMVSPRAAMSTGLGR